MVDSKNILRTEFDAVSRLLKLAPVLSQSLRLVAAACRDKYNECWRVMKHEGTIRVATSRSN